jgi:hypothetical protein
MTRRLPIDDMSAWAKGYDGGGHPGECVEPGVAFAGRRAAGHSERPGGGVLLLGRLLELGPGDSGPLHRPHRPVGDAGPGVVELGPTLIS